MENNIESENTNKMLQVLDWAYDKSLDGIPGFSDPLIKFAETYTKGNGTPEEKINSLIRWQISKTSTSGFLTGLGGLITLPISIPADISTGIYIHMRMIAAIAHIGGYDINDDRVKSLVYLCLVGEPVKDILKDGGIAIGSKLAFSYLKSIPGKTLTKINRMVGFRLATKFGQKGILNLVKFVPLAGGIVGATVNAIGTNLIGNVAKKVFISTDNDEKNGADLNESEYAEFSEVVNLDLLKFYSYINIIKVDGIVKEEEIEMFESEINHSFLPDKIKLDLISKVYEKEKTEVDYSHFQDKTEDSLELLRNLLKFAKIDNEFHILEKMFIKDVGKQIGFSAEDLEELINSEETNEEIV